MKQKEITRGAKRLCLKMKSSQRSHIWLTHYQRNMTSIIKIWWWVTCLYPALAPGSDWLWASGLPLCCHAWLVMKLMTINTWRDDSTNWRKEETKHWHYLGQRVHLHVFDKVTLRKAIQQPSQNMYPALLYDFCLRGNSNHKSFQMQQYLAALCTMNGIVNQFWDFMFLKCCKTIFSSSFLIRLCLMSCIYYRLICGDGPTKDTITNAMKYT